MLAAPSVRPSVNLEELIVSTLNHNTSVKQMLQKRNDKTIKYLVTDSDTITNKTEIADTLATSFAAKSSPDHYQKKIRMIRDREEENTLDFESDNDEKYNAAFSKRKATDSATVPDEIHCRFLKVSALIAPHALAHCDSTNAFKGIWMQTNQILQPVLMRLGETWEVAHCVGLIAGFEAFTNVYLKIASSTASTLILVVCHLAKKPSYNIIYEQLTMR